MTTLTLGKIKFVNKGTWSSTATYSKGDVVQYNGVSYVYKNDTSKAYTSLFFGPLSSFPISGTVSSMAAQSNTFTITWTVALPSISDNRIVPNSNIYAYSKWIEPDSKITSIVNNSTSSSTITISKNITSDSALGSHTVTIGPRRMGNNYEVALNDTDWDLLSEGLIYAGEWASTTNYLPGQIVVKNDNSYLCTQGNVGVNPLFDYVGCWEPYLIGDDALPHERIAVGINANPFGWRGHPYITNPSWSSNTYSGIPWNLPTSHRTTGLAEYWAPAWNTPWIRGFMSFRGTIGLGADGRGHQLAKGYSEYLGVGQVSDYRLQVGEITAEYRNQFFTDEVPHYGNRSFSENFRKSSNPKPMQINRQWGTTASLLSDGSVLIGGWAKYTGLGYQSSYYAPLNQLPASTFNNRKIVKLGGCNGYSRESDSFQMALDEYGELWAWGYNGDGACGVGPETHLTGTAKSTGDFDDVYSPFCLEKDIYFEGNRIVDVITGTSSCYALDEAGQIWSWGWNGFGQLGYSTSGFLNASYSQAPYKIPINWSTYGGIQKIIISERDGNGRLMILDGEGHVWAQGYNTYGETGNGNTTDYSNTSGTITRVSSTQSWSIGGGIKNIWSTEFNSFFLDTSLNLWSCGYGGYYLYGSATTNITTPIQVYGPGGALTNIVSVGTSGRDGTTLTLLDHNGITYGGGWNAYGAAGIGATGSVGDNVVYYQQSGTPASTQGFARCLMPSNFYESGNKIVDIWGYGDYDATSGHLQSLFWLSERGDLLATGRDYNYNLSGDGNTYAPSPHNNLL